MSNNFHLQLYRGTTQQNNAYTGPAGELTVDTTLSKLRLHDGSTAGGVEIGGMPTGSIIPYAGSTAPAGYLLCDGSAISRSTYSALFAIIGTTYGAGDGNSTFNLPTEEDIFKNIIPSNHYNDLSPSEGGTYIAPSNGYFYLSAVYNAPGQFIQISNGIYAISNTPGQGGYTQGHIFLPVSKNDMVNIYYSVFKINNFRFIYAKENQLSVIKY